MSKGARSTTSGPLPASTHIALLRGINVGGRNKLPMAELAGFFEKAGCKDVRTYIQSGNVVFTAGAAAAKQAPAQVSEMIRKTLNARIPVVLRSAEELRKAATGNPFLRAGADPTTLHIAFLADVPARGRAVGLDPDRSPGDSFELRGREIYLHLPNGVARTKLTNDSFDSKLGTVSTLRNWRTVLKLVEMSSGGA